MAEYAISGDVATLLGDDHTAGDPAALWVESSARILTDSTTGRVGGRLRVTLEDDGTFEQAGLPETVSGATPLYRLTVDSLSLRRAGLRKGLTTSWFPLTADRDLTWVIDNYVETTLITSEVAANIAAAAALGATNDTATASFVGDSASSTSSALNDRFAMGVIVAGPGIDPTGATDSTTAIQAKIDAATTYGAPLYLPEGTYLTTGLEYVNGLTLRGAGAGKTTLKLSNTGTAPVLGGLLGTIGSTGEPVTDLVVEDITFDGDQANNAVAIGYAALLHTYSAARVNVNRCRFINSPGYGIGLQGYPSNASADKQGPITDVRIDSCQFINNGYRQNVAVSADGLDVKDSERITLVNCYASGNSDKGFNLRGRFISVVGCHSNSNAVGYDFNAHNDPSATNAADSYVKAVACSAKSNTGSGFAATATENSLTHAEFYGCDALDNGGSGIQTTAPVSTGRVRLRVHGGNFKRNTLRGIYADNAQEVHVVGASLRDNTGDGARVNNQAGAIFDACHYEGNGGYGLRAMGTSANIDVRGGVFASNTSGPITGAATSFRVTGNPRGLTATSSSAATLSIFTHSRPLVTVSGATTVTAITATHAGDEVTLLFSSTAQVTDGGNIKLAGNFTGAAGRTLTLVCDGTDWIEKSRTTT